MGRGAMAIRERGGTGTCAYFGPLIPSSSILNDQEPAHKHAIEVVMVAVG